MTLATNKSHYVLKHTANPVSREYRVAAQLRANSMSGKCHS